MVDLNCTVKIGAEVVFSDLEGEAAILNVKTGIYYGLDALGTRIWNLVHRHGALAQVFAIMREEYDVADEMLERDIIEFIARLSEKGLVEIV